MSKTYLSVRHQQIMIQIVWIIILKTTRFYFQHIMGNKIPILGISLNIRGLFFHKVAYPRYDVPSEMIWTDNIKDSTGGQT
jgi:hypothetical protein